jgi:hypothetical protein
VIEFLDSRFCIPGPGATGLSGPRDILIALIGGLCTVDIEGATLGGRGSALPGGGG